MGATSKLGLRLALLIAALTLATATSAAAQGAPESAAAARALFHEGVELAREQRYAEAAEQFRRALALRPAPAIAFNLASALVHLGRLVESSELLEQVLRAPETTPELRESATTELAALQARMAHLTVRASGDLTGVELRIDQRPLLAEGVGVALPVDPGPHDVLALRDSAEVARERVELAEGGRAEVTLDVPAATSAPIEAVTPAEPTEPEPQGGDDTGIWIGVSIGAAALVAGAIVLAVFVADPGEEAPITGNTNPAVITW